MPGRSVCVVGASGGLGAPISRRLAAAGARLTLCGRDASRLESVVPGAAIVAADLAEHDGVRAKSEAVRCLVDLHSRIAGSGAVAGTNPA